MLRLPTSSISIAVLLLAGVGCSASSSSDQGGGGRGGSSASGGSAAGGSGAFGGSGAGGGLLDAGHGDSGSSCSTDPQVDDDGDGFSEAQGDCNDCDPHSNPGAYDVPGNGVDEDCSGGADDEASECDEGLAIEGDDPLDAARAIGLCRAATDKSWGVLSAKYVAADGTQGAGYPVECGDLAGGNQVPGTLPHPLSRGILPRFGDVVRPRAGHSLLALSSGIAREGKNHFSPDGEHMCTASYTPDGFPKDSPSCKVTTAGDHNALNPMALELELRVPSNAYGFSFDFNFYTFEWPDYICRKYNDFFVALLWSGHASTPVDHNISFDSQGNPVSVNNALVDVCDPSLGQLGLGGRIYPCSRGVAELKGTGFEDHAATSWLQTSAAVKPGETIKLRFAVWDMGDENLDSSVLLDHFVWQVEPGDPDAPPVTKPAPK